MRLYHRTMAKAAQSILQGGFKDATGAYMTDRLHTGVWLSDTPLDENEGAVGDVLLAVDVPDDVFAAEVARYEWVQDIGYREFLVPAELVNRVAAVGVLEVDEGYRWTQLSEDQIRQNQEALARWMGGA